MKAEASTTAKYEEGKSKKNTDTTFGKEGQSLLDIFLKNQKQDAGDTAANQNQAYLNSLQNSQAPQIDAKQMLDNIKAASDQQTQVDIAQGRSKFYNKPEGRNDINLADTVARNAAARDAKLAETQSAVDQFNAQQQSALREANRASAQSLTPAQQQAAARNQQLLQALQILAGKSENENTSGWGVSGTVGAKFGA